MTEQPEVSVILPTYNSAWSIEAAIDSVIAQTFENWEMIVVDDGSQDDTRDRVAFYDDERISYVFQENSGRSNARNSATRLARGRWLAFLDSDDIWLPKKVELQLFAADQHPEAVMIYTLAHVLASGNGNSSHRCLEKSRFVSAGRPGCSDCLRDFLVGRFDVRTSTVMAPRNVVIDVGGFDPSFQVGEDWDLFIRLAARGEVVYLDEPLAGYWLGLSINRLERGLRYGSHQALLRVMKKNIRPLEQQRLDPRFSVRVLASWEWRCALVEFDLGDRESARSHVENALRLHEDVFSDQNTGILLADHLLDVHGDGIAMGEFQEGANHILSNLVTLKMQRDRLLRYAKGYLHLQRAFKAYSTGMISAGLGHAASAVRQDIRNLKNRGLWMFPIRQLLEASRP